MSKQLLVTAPLAILGSAFGQGGWKEQLAGLGISLGLNGLMMKYSRGAESQADLGGVQALHAAKYDPAGLATFFKKLEALSKTQPGKLEAFFASHPAPQDREQAVEKEIQSLSRLDNPRKDSQEFHRIKLLVASMPAPRAPNSKMQKPGTPQGQDVPAPSSRYVNYRQRDGLYSFQIPENWQVVSETREGVSIVPPGGASSSGDQSQISYGMMVSVAKGDRPSNLEEATNQLLDQLMQENSYLQEVRGSRENFEFAGERGIKILFTGRSPATSQMENVWIITRNHSAGLISFIFVSPENQFGTYKPIFNRILSRAKF